MVFNSFEFLLFFPIVSLFYFVIPHKYRWAWLLAASCFFYGFFKWEYLLILMYTIVVDYFAALWIAQSKGVTRKFALIASLLANVGVLAFFKYGNFFLENLNAVLFKINQPTYDLMDILLPIGLSFHTFQAMSYTIEVYRGKVPVEKRFGMYALYVMFYPQLVAGPIERPQNVIHQYNREHFFEFNRVVGGLRLMLWGMFKKVFIADRMAVFVTAIYGSPQEYQGLPLLVATLFFSIQIYCDFSGYTDIGLGAARVMGFDLMKNFNRPYISKSISEFWNRWHISLSSWFRDYLYIPLGGNRVSNFRLFFNLFLVFLVSGIWHGAAWTYIIWGALHGIYLIIGRQTKTLQNKLIGTSKIGNSIHWLVTICLVVFAWIFFRAHTLADAKYIVLNLFKPSNLSISELLNLIGMQNVWFVLLGVFIMEGVQYLQSKQDITKTFNRLKKWQRWGAYYFILILVLVFGIYDGTQFIYFQF